MRNRCVLTLLIFLCGCQDNGNNLPYVINWNRSYTQITLDCIDKVTFGARLKVVINSQAEYEKLTYDYFQKPLDEWRERNYPSILEYIKRDNPGLTDQEYARLAEEELYKYLPFMGTKNCLQPAIDFSTFTLLGYGIDASGCDDPDYLIDLHRDTRLHETSFHVTVIEYGTCELVIYKIIWLLIPKIPDYYKVTFSTNTIVRDNKR
jgi:hypothetical protein